MKQSKSAKSNTKSTNQTKAEVVSSSITEVYINVGRVVDILDDNKTKLQDYISSKLELANSEELRVFRFEFDENNTEVNKIFEKLSKVNSLTDFSFNQEFDYNWQKQSLFEFISRQHKLRHLKVQIFNNEQSDKALEKSFKGFAKSLQQMEHLESIYLEITNIRQNYLQLLIEGLEKLKNLTSFTLIFKDTQEPIQGIDSLASFIKKANKQLSKVHINLDNSSTLLEQETKLLIEAFQSNKNIRDLTFSIMESLEFSKKLPQQLSETFSKLQHLQNLSLGLTINIKAAQFKQILESLQTLSTLSSFKLDLNSSNVTGEIVANLLKHLKSLTSLNLNLSNVVLKNKFSLISQSIKQLTKLEKLTLDLSSTEVGSQKKGCETLFDFLPSLNLKHLSLSIRNEDFADKFLSILFKQVGQCTNLVQLQLEHGQYDMEEQDVKDLVQSLFNCDKLRQLTFCDALGLVLDHAIPKKQFLKLVDCTMQY